MALVIYDSMTKKIVHKQDKMTPRPVFPPRYTMAFIPLPASEIKVDRFSDELMKPYMPEEKLNVVNVIRQGPTVVREKKKIIVPELKAKEDAIKIRTEKASQNSTAQKAKPVTVRSQTAPTQKTSPAPKPVEQKKPEPVPVDKTNEALQKVEHTVEDYPEEVKIFEEEITVGVKQEVPKFVKPKKKKDFWGKLFGDNKG